MLAQLIANIVVLASIYALLSLGYVIVYRVSQIMNLAHGELMMFGAYFFLTMASLSGGRGVVAVTLTLVLSLALGLVVYLALLRWMTGQSVLAAVLMTIALGTLLRGLAMLFWSPTQQYPGSLLGWTNPALALPGGARMSAADVALVATAAAVFLALYLFLRFTAFGIRMRAAGRNPLLAAQRGINLHRIYAMAWALSTLLAGAVGMLLSLNLGVDNTMAVIGLKAFPAALVGGLDSFLGALLGAFICATAEVILIQYVDPLLSDVVPFFVLLAVLAVRPWGLLGSREQFDRV